MNKTNEEYFDPLTGIFNRKYFEEQLTKELVRASRYQHYLSILLVDIDEFERVNDDFGDQVGDQVLREVSRIMSESVRVVDVVARYEDDKFTIMLPETRKNEAKRTADRIMNNVRKFDFFKDSLKIRELTVSIGVASYPEDAGKAFDMMKKAQTALTKAKSAGGSKVILSE